MLQGMRPALLQPYQVLPYTKLQSKLLRLGGFVCCALRCIFRNPNLGASGNGIGLRSQPIYVPSGATPLR